MLDLRLYRVTLLPFAVALIVVAFSLHTGPSALSSSQPVAHFDAQQAYDVMIALASAGGDPAPGSAADDALAQAIADTPLPPGSPDELPERADRARTCADDGRRAHDRDRDRDPRRHAARASR